MDDGGDKSLREALKRVAVTLKDAGVSFALSGGYASWARGGPEPAHDVDFFLAPQDVDRAMSALRAAGLTVEDAPEDWLVKVRDGDVVVDLIHAPTYQPIMDQLVRADEVDVDSVRMPVLAATDLVLSKLAALDERYCDFSSVYPDVRALREQVDWERVRRESSQSPFARAFLRTCEELRIIDRAQETSSPDR